MLLLDKSSAFRWAEICDNVFVLITRLSKLIPVQISPLLVRFEYAGHSLPGTWLTYDSTQNAHVPSPRISAATIKRRRASRVRNFISESNNVTRTCQIRSSGPAELVEAEA